MPKWVRYSVFVYVVMIFAGTLAARNPKTVKSTMPGSIDDGPQFHREVIYVLPDAPRVRHEVQSREDLTPPPTLFAATDDR